MPFGGVTVKDVDAHDFVKAFAAHLRKYVLIINFCVYTIAGTHIQTFVRIGGH